ncbi:MAG TPA: tetratricopeptide repeat protein [Polyangiaceae bacterium]|nr:tetratricopeptide repeat protein [Polyangiaceae bacterium]
MLAPGCGAAPAKTAVDAPKAAASAERVEVPRTIVTPTSETNVAEMFSRARVAYGERRFADAAKDFDRIVLLDPDGPYAKESLFDAAASHDQGGELDAAAARYQEVARRFPSDPLADESLVRAVRLLAYRERFPEAGAAADRLLSHVTALPPLERIVAYGGKALALVTSSDPDAAAYFIEKGRDVVETERLDAAGILPKDLAALYFALGELRRVRGERVRFDPVPARFGDVLEQRCQLLLDAQSAYSDAMRAYDAHWSAMAGYRVGELYQKLHEELMRVPPPAVADTKDKAQLFEGAMRVRYSVLLRKGLTMMEHTVALSDRTGEHSAWVDRAAASKASLERAIQDEEAAIARLPYSRADLEAALDRLQKTARQTPR